MNELIKTTLDNLHEQAQAEKAKPVDRSLPRFMAVTREEGQLLHFLAGLTQAKNIVEFGCSFGISTIYLADAASKTGGVVTTTDIDPIKIAGTTKNLAAAGLGNYVKILEGDATQTLATVEGDIDFLFLDGAKHLYLPIFQLLRPKLHKGAVIFADNTNNPETHPFVNHILDAGDEYTAMHLFENRALLAYVS